MFSNDPTTTPLTNLLNAIWEGSVLSLSTSDDEHVGSDDQIQLHASIGRFDATARLHASGTPPPLCVPSACWAVQTMHFFARIFLDRIETNVAMPEHLVATEPTGRDACHHWSVDLAFRVLPDLERRCGNADALDPLRQTMRAVAGRWPLSSVGIDCEMAPASRAVVLSNESLRACLLDRLMASNRDTMAAWPELSDDIARAGLFQHPEQSPFEKMFADE